MEKYPAKYVDICLWCKSKYCYNGCIDDGGLYRVPEDQINDLGEWIKDLPMKKSFKKLAEELEKMKLDRKQSPSIEFCEGYNCAVADILKIVEGYEKSIV